MEMLPSMSLTSSRK